MLASGLLLTPRLAVKLNVSVSIDERMAKGARSLSFATLRLCARKTFFLLRGFEEWDQAPTVESVDGTCAWRYLHRSCTINHNDKDV